MNAYASSGAENVIRGLKMIKDKECVIIQDEISLKDNGDIFILCVIILIIVYISLK